MSEKSATESLQQQEQRERERMEIIDRTLDRISREQWNGFEGFREWIDGTGYVERDAGGKYIDRSKPEGQQESVIPMRDLALAHGYVFERGRIEESTFIIPIGEGEKKVPANSIFILTNNISAWDNSRIFEANHLLQPSR